MKIKTRLLLFLVPAIVFTLAALTAFSYWNTGRQAEEIANTTAQFIAAQQADLIFDKIRNAEVAAVSLVSILKEQRKAEKPSREALSTAAKGVTSASKDYFGVWVLWEPNAFDGDDASFVGNAEYGNAEGRANAYWMREGEALVYDPSDNYDHESYYTYPKAAGKLSLIPPYRDMDTTEKVLMSTVAMPIIDEGKTLGVVGIDLEMEFIQGMVDAVKPYETGYAMLISDTGAILAEPAAKKKQTDALPTVPADILARMKTGQPFSLEGDSVLNGETMQFHYIPVKLASVDAPWYFMVALPDKKVMEQSNTALLTQLGISIVAILVLGGLVFYVAGGVAGPLQRIAGYAHSVAAGDYEARVSRRGFVAELIDLQTSLRSMVESLVASMAQSEARNEEARQEAERARKAMNEAEQARIASEENRKAMLGVAARVNMVAEKLQATSEELSSRIAAAGHETQEQNTLMAETVVAISGMADSITRVSDSAADAAKFAETTGERAQEGAEVVNRTLEAFDSIRRETDSLATQISDLSTRSEAITSILGMINDIADQTNLLALNAAIEAARAGEYGRGFAVVADEVRKLAEKTMEATKQVSEAVSAIRLSMDESAEGVARAEKTVNDTVALGHNAQNALGEIVSLVSKMNDQIHDIAGLCSEQEKTSENVGGTVEKLRLLSASVLEVMDEGAAITRTLEPEARELGLLVEQLSHDA